MGVALGNWLVLEQWMNEVRPFRRRISLFAAQCLIQPWFNASANNNASVIDEWNFMLAIGDNATAVMHEHYATWVTEADIEALHEAGANHLRIPVGFWAFIPTIAPEPYLSQGGQLEYLENVLAWAYARKMYAIIDLHALPGSQNGEVSNVQSGLACIRLTGLNAPGIVGCPEC